jgi:metal-responsive CopG/Arc/MetJ family transcriptional regulator
MDQVKISLTAPLVEFLDNHQAYGFKDKSALVRSALTHFQRDLRLQ